jgi:hypothetical protein
VSRRKAEGPVVRAGSSRRRAVLLLHRSVEGRDHTRRRADRSYRSRDQCAREHRTPPTTVGSAQSSARRRAWGGSLVPIRMEGRATAEPSCRRRGPLSKTDSSPADADRRQRCDDGRSQRTTRRCQAKDDPHVEPRAALGGPRPVRRPATRATGEQWATTALSAGSELMSGR